MMSVVAYHWKNLSEETKTEWKSRARRLNAQPLPGQFNSLPEIYMGNNAHEWLHQIFLKRDFSSFLHKMGKKFRKYENKTGLYNKNENVHGLKQQVENKFYFCQTVPYTIILSLFGKS